VAVSAPVVEFNVKLKVYAFADKLVVTPSIVCVTVPKVYVNVVFPSASVAVGIVSD